MGVNVTDQSQHRGEVEQDVENVLCNVPIQSQQAQYVKKGALSQVTNDETSSYNVNAVKLLQNVKKQKHQASKTLMQQITKILKRNAKMCKCHYQIYNCSQSSNILDFDDTDLFFLSMSREIKKLPKLQQAKIKLSLSNSVLST